MVQGGHGPPGPPAPPPGSYAYAVEYTVDEIKSVYV